MIRKDARRKAFLRVILLSVCLTAVQNASPGQGAQLKEADVEKLLAQGGAYYQKGDYKLAIGCYLEASALSQSRMNLSQAYFGLSLCYFYLRDPANETKYMRKVIEVDPHKEISELFYPKSFALLFKQVRKEISDKNKPAAERITPQKPVPARTDEPKKAAPDEKKKAEGVKEEAAKKETETQKAEDKGKEPEKKDVPPPAKTETPLPVAPPTPAADFGISEEEKNGHWEINAHFSSWSVNLIKALFENSLTNKVGEEIQNEIVKKSGTIQAGLVKWNFTQNLAFDSAGSTYGFEVRYFSRGPAGTFSLGLALEKMFMRLLLKGSVRQDFTNGASALVDVNAQLETGPFATHFNFRWEAGSGMRITPYFVAGFGVAPLKGTFSYTYAGTYHKGDLTESIGDSKEKNFEEFSQDIDFNIPKFIFILQLHFGIKAQLYQGLSLLGEAGIWDGFVLRGGLAYRF